MLDTRIGRLGSVLLGVGLIVCAVVLTMRRHPEPGRVNTGLDPKQTKELYQERVRESRHFMRLEPFEVGGR